MDEHLRCILTATGLESELPKLHSLYQTVSYGETAISLIAQAVLIRQGNSGHEEGTQFWTDGLPFGWFSWFHFGSINMNCVMSQIV